MSMPQDLAAIDVYIKTQPIKTKAATKVRDEWTVWYDGVGWWGSYSQENYDHARNLKHNFDLANAVNAEETAAVRDQMQNGLTTEELEGGTRRTLSDGTYAEPLLSESTRMTLGLIGVAAAVGGALWLGKSLLESQRSLLSKFL